MASEAGKTGAGPTAAIAIEQYFPREQRVVQDDCAFSILPLALRAFVLLTRPRFMRDLLIRRSEKDVPGMWSGMLCRKRYIEDSLAAFAQRLDAVVNLGAGLDTVAYRVPALSGVPVWEVDQPDNTRQKEHRLRAVFGAVPERVHLAAVDFDRQDIGAALTSSGYDLAMRTSFILEGVTQYLTGDGLKSIFDFLSRAARGSLLAFTYVRKDFIDGREPYGWEKAYEKYVAGGIWLMGLEPERVDEFLGKYAWRLVEDVSYDLLAEKYVKPTGRKLDSTQVERIALAEKM